MNYMKISKNDVANGVGIRVVLWVSGCRCHCPGCHNEITWDFNAGQPYDSAAEKEIFTELEKPYVRGITLSGGHPLEPENIPTLIELLKKIKLKFPAKDIWLYTGYTLDINNFLEKNKFQEILCLCDVVVDGPYIENLRNLSLAYYGSMNQRAIDVHKTLKENKILEFKEGQD